MQFTINVTFEKNLYFYFDVFVTSLDVLFKKNIRLTTDLHQCSIYILHYYYNHKSCITIELKFHLNQLLDRLLSSVDIVFTFKWLVINKIKLIFSF